jgi:hypothetical protein
MKPLKPSIHLIYGIIIGILLAACTGQTTSETSTPTNSIADQKQFKEIHRAYWNDDETGFYATVLLKYGDRTSWNPGKRLIHSPEGSPDDLRKAGWVIIDMELHDGNIPHYLIGR